MGIHAGGGDDGFLMVEPSTVAEPLPDAPQIAQLMRERSWRLAAVAAAGFIGGISEALFLVMIVRVITSITEEEDELQLVGGYAIDRPEALYFAAGSLALRLITAVIAHHQSARLANEMVADTRSRLLRAYFGADWATQDQEPSGALQDYVTSYSLNIATYLKALTWFIVSSATLIAMLALALLLDPLGAISLVVTIGVLGALLRPLRAAISRRSLRANAARMELANKVSEYSPLALEFRVFNVEETADSQLDALTETSRRESVRFQFLQGLATPIYSVLAYAALLGAVIVMSQINVDEVSALAAVMLLVLRSLTYGQAVQSALSAMSASRPVADELLEKVAALERAEHTAGTVQTNELRSIQARGVGFAYADESAVLFDIDFEIKRHEVIGIVGPSGSGKSTLVQLLLGLRTPTTGSILADGVDVRSINPENWSRQVTFVPQSPGFLSGTVRDNIRFLRDWVTDDDLRDAARRANLLTEMEQGPQGLDRDVGERGGQLSGGQQQRVSIARALVETPQLIILDEPTSALDARSEHLLGETLRELRDEMAVLIIAHRLTTLEICDRIMVVQDGRIVDFDTPANLAINSDFYREALELSGLSAPGTSAEA